MIDVCHVNGVEPMVTLNHMTLPLWLASQDGCLNPKVIDYFARYVQYVMPILHDVTWMCTINEPNMVALTRGGAEGTDFVAASLPAPDPDISAVLVQAHKKAREILSANPNIKVRLDYRLSSVPCYTWQRKGDGRIPMSLARTISPGLLSAMTSSESKHT